ncbi:hypothetical protein HY501_00080 [Candidatus Woesearchaeota archaeon]|nr:hypothetical protein [Candidatus Woesearchaeota archaeon]
MKNKNTVLVLVLSGIFLGLIILETLLFYTIAVPVGYAVVNTSFAAGVVTIELKGECTLSLHAGWNLVSFCANRTNTSIQTVLLPIEDEYRYVLLWNESSQSFIVYSPRAAAPLFTEFNFSKSYFVYYLPTETDLGITGTSFDDLNVTLIQGWNTPTYPYGNSRNVSTYLDPTLVRFLLKWNVSLQEFMTFSPRAATPPFAAIHQGEGQFLYSIPAQALLHYNRTG